MLWEESMDKKGGGGAIYKDGDTNDVARCLTVSLFLAYHW